VGNSWELEAHYLALGIIAVISVLSPQRIVIGGGVMRRVGLLPLVQQKVIALMNGYLEAPVEDEISAYIVRPALDSRAGVLGAIALAARLG
jgi:fructokinase